MSTHAEALTKCQTIYAQIEAEGFTSNIKASDKSRKRLFQALMDSAIAGHSEGNNIHLEYDLFKRLVSVRPSLSAEGRNKVIHDLKRVFAQIPPLTQKKFWAALQSGDYLTLIIEDVMEGKSLLPLSVQKSIIKFLAETIPANPATLFKNDSMKAEDVRLHLERTKKEHGRRQAIMNSLKQEARLSGITNALEELHDFHQRYLDRGKLDAFSYAIKGVLAGDKEGTDTQLECKIIAPLMVTDPTDLSYEAYKADIGNIFDHLSQEQMEVLLRALVKHNLFFMSLYNFEIEADGQDRLKLSPINPKNLEPDKSATISLPRDDVYSFLVSKRNPLLPERVWKIADKISFGIDPPETPETEAQSLWSEEDLNKLARLLEHKYALEPGTLVLTEQDYIVYGEIGGERLEIRIVPDKETGTFTDVMIPALEAARENLLDNTALTAGMELNRKGYRPDDYKVLIKEGTWEPILTDKEDKEIDAFSLPDIKPAFIIPAPVWNETYDYGYSKPLTPDFIKMASPASGINLVGEFNFSAIYRPLTLPQEETISDIEASPVENLSATERERDTTTGQKINRDASGEKAPEEEPQPRLLWILEKLLADGFKPKKDLHIFYNYELDVESKGVSTVVVQAMDENRCFQIAICVNHADNMKEAFEGHRWNEILSPVGYSTHIFRESVDWDANQSKIGDLIHSPYVFRAPCYTKEQYLNSIDRFAYTTLEENASEEELKSGEFLRPQLKTSLSWRGEDIALQTLQTIRAFYEDTEQQYRTHDEVPIAHGPLADLTTPKRLFDAFNKRAIQGLDHLKGKEALFSAALAIEWPPERMISPAPRGSSPA